MSGGAADSSAPLAGVRVLDFTRVLAGPFCTRLLSDLGADVIKVEPPGADFTRGMGRRVNGLSGYFTQQNAGKRNISIDLTKPEGIELVLRLVEHVDVLVENFRPGVMAKFGLDEQRLRGHNPRLIHCAISGFGQDSPEEDKRAFAGVLHAMTGIIYNQWQADGKGAMTDSVHAFGDTITGLQSLAAILAALYKRERTGRGEAIDMAMHDVMLSVNEYAGIHLFETPDPWRAYRSTMCEGKDGWLAYAGDYIYNFEALCAAMERPDLLADPRFATPEDRQGERPAIEALMREWVMAQPSIAEAERKLDAQGLPSGPVRTLPEALASPQAAHRGMVHEVSDRGPAGGTVRVVDSPYNFSDSITGPRGPAAYRGEHNHEILRELLALSDADIEALEASGAIIKSVKKKR